MEISYFEMSYDDIPYIAEMENKYFGQPWKEESIAHYFEAGNTLFIVAKNENEVVGYCALMGVLNESELISIAVHEEYRNMGIANEILDIAFEMAAENGIDTVNLEVRESNVPAIKLYENNMFKQVGRRKNYYSNPQEDALLYTKLLDIRK